VCVYSPLLDTNLDELAVEALYFKLHLKRRHAREWL